MAKVKSTNINDYLLRRNVKRKNSLNYLRLSLLIRRPRLYFPLSRTHLVKITEKNNERIRNKTARIVSIHKNKRASCQHRVSEREESYSYLWLIRLDFIDGLVLEFESQKFQHFFLDKKSCSTV